MVPDIITAAKGLTSGYLPMSAVIVGEKMWSTFELEKTKLGVFSHGFTSSGHPTVAACALANLSIIVYVMRSGRVVLEGTSSELARHGDLETVYFGHKSSA